MKKIALFLAAALLLSMVTVCFADAELQTIRLGTSNVTMSVPVDYAKGEMTSEDTDEGMVAYYASESSGVDFDVYHWALASDETLEDAAKEEAAEYETEAAAVELNGIAAWCYTAEEESEGETYATATYMIEDNGYIVELVFWLDGENAQTEVDAMLATLTVGTPKEAPEGAILLGTSDLFVKPEHSFVAGEMTREDTSEVQVGYFCSEETSLDFDVYHWAKASGETLENAAAAEAAEYEAELKETEINGMKVFCYTASEESDGETYETVTYMVEDGDYLVEIVFWLDGEAVAAEAEAIMATLSR